MQHDVRNCYVTPEVSNGGHTRAGKSLRFFRNKIRFLDFLDFLGFNVRTVARGTLDTARNTIKIQIKAYIGLWAYTKVN